MNERLGRLIGPKISCPGATESQISQFYRNNTIVGGKIRVNNPQDLETIRGVMAFFSVITLKDGAVGISHLVSIGSKIDIS